jgi:hypothetical protein
MEPREIIENALNIMGVFIAPNHSRCGDGEVPIPLSYLDLLWPVLLEHEPQQAQQKETDIGELRP